MAKEHNPARITFHPSLSDRLSKSFTCDSISISNALVCDHITSDIHEMFGKRSEPSERSSEDESQTNIIEGNSIIYQSISCLLYTSDAADE